MTDAWKDDWSVEARAEYAEAVRHYLDIDPDLADDLESRVDSAVQLLLEMPESAAGYLGDTRRKILKRFPYGLVYRIEVERRVLRIVAFTHQSRRPDYWADRT